MSDYKLLNHTRKRLLCSRKTPRDFYAQSQLKETSFAQGQLQETSMLNHNWMRLTLLKDNSKRLPLLNHNWKRLILTITKNWIRFWYTIRGIQNTMRNRTDSVFLRHLKILRYKLLKEFSKLLMFCIWRLAQSVGLFLDNMCVCSYLFSKSSSLFIEDLRDVWNLAVASTCPSWSFDSSPLIFFLIWYLSYEELNSNPFCFQRNNVCCNIVVILVLIWRQVIEKVVAETSAELVVVHFVHCPLSTLMKGASDEICFWWS